MRFYLKIAFIYLLWLIPIEAIYIFISHHYFNLSTDILYLWCGVFSTLTFFIVLMACFIKKKWPDYVGMFYIGSMTAKMAIALAFVVAKQSVKENVLLFLINYFLILFIEVIIFIKILNKN